MNKSIIFQKLSYKFVGFLILGFIFNSFRLLFLPISAMLLLENFKVDASQASSPNNFSLESKLHALKIQHSCENIEGTVSKDSDDKTILNHFKLPKEQCPGKNCQ